MDLEKEYVIKFSRGKIALFFLNILIFLIIGIDAIIILILRHMDGLFDVLLLILMMAGIVLYTPSLFLLVKKYFSRSPGFIIGPGGIVDNTILDSVGAIPWNQVRSWSKVKILYARYLIVFVQHPEQYWKTGSLFARFILWANKIYSKSPITMNTYILDIKFDEFIQVFTRYYERYRQNSKERIMTEISIDEFFTRRHARLTRIATLATVAAWFSLFIFAASAVLQVFDVPNSETYKLLVGYKPGLWDLVSQEPLYTITVFVSVLKTFLQGVVYALVLRGITLGLRMIVETDLNYREKETEGNDEP